MRQQQMYYGTTKEIRLCAFLALSQNHSASWANCRVLHLHMMGVPVEFWPSCVCHSIDEERSLLPPCHTALLLILQLGLIWPSVRDVLEVIALPLALEVEPVSILLATATLETAPMQKGHAHSVRLFQTRRRPLTAGFGRIGIWRT
jgi:hypothetical protein